MSLPRIPWVSRLVAIVCAVASGLPLAIADEKRVGIVYSDTARQNYWGDYGYYQLYMAMQHQCAMTGVPYDLIDEDDLTDAATLAKYDAIVIPLMDFVTPAKRSQILTALNQVTANGLSIITSGFFLANDPAGGVHPTFVTDLANLIGVEAVNFYGPVPANILAGSFSTGNPNGTLPGEFGLVSEKLILNDALTNSILHFPVATESPDGRIFISCNRGNNQDPDPDPTNGHGESFEFDELGELVAIKRVQSNKNRDSHDIPTVEWSPVDERLATSYAIHNQTDGFIWHSSTGETIDLLTNRGTVTGFNNTYRMHFEDAAGSVVMFSREGGAAQNDWTYYETDDKEAAAWDERNTFATRSYLAARPALDGNIWLAAKPSSYGYQGGATKDAQKWTHAAALYKFNRATRNLEDPAGNVVGPITSMAEVDLCGWNLLPNSALFTSATWNSLRAEAYTGATTQNRFGDVTEVVKLRQTNINDAVHRISGDFTADGVSEYTCSVYVKAAEWSHLNLYLDGKWASFSCADGSLHSDSGGIVEAGSAPDGTGWHRLWFTSVPSAGTQHFRLHLVDDADPSDIVFSGVVNRGVWIDDAQVNKGKIRPYNPTTTLISPAVDPVIMIGADVLAGKNLANFSWEEITPGYIECVWGEVDGWEGSAHPFTQANSRWKRGRFNLATLQMEEVADRGTMGDGLGSSGIIFGAPAIHGEDDFTVTINNQDGGGVHVVRRIKSGIAYDLKSSTENHFCYPETIRGREWSGEYVPQPKLIVHEGFINSDVDWKFNVHFMVLGGESWSPKANPALPPMEGSGPPADGTHPAMPGYQSGETIRSYNQIWTSTFTPAAGTDPAGSTALCNYQFTGSVEPAVLGITFPDGRRNVHFGNEQLMQDTNVLWSALQWCLFGNETPVAMRLSRQRSLFFARNDMDQSQFQEEVPLVHVPLLDIITEWKEQHDFVGSYYINIGNRPSQGEFTDWSFSGPLYQQYEALGSEIGTHSYTHPNDTSALTAPQLDFEFRQSVQEIQIHLGSPSPGAAIPGIPENQFVRDTVAPWLTYLSGRAAIADTDFGYSSAFGRLRPGYDLFYFCLNTSPDFTLVGFRGLTAQQAQQIWLDEYTGHHEHAPMPVVHWLWHDYAPVLAEPGYTREMFDVMVGTAAANGSEFVTGIDLYQRVEALQAASLDVTQIDPDTVSVQVTSTDAGRHCLALADNQSISSVSDWYAYDGTKLYLPKNGGNFTIDTSGPPAVVTRISKLPQRAELHSLTGNGIELSFTFDGEGDVTVLLNETGGPLTISGADNVTRNGSTATLSFAAPDLHSVVIGSPDRDGDGHLNTIETSADVDGDTIPNDLDLDSDGDDLPDAAEDFSDFDGDTIPNIWDPDSDNDTMTDGWEMLHGLNHLDPSDAALDSDLDWQTNAEEFASGTSPTNASDLFAIVWEPGPPFQVTTTGRAGRIYTFQRSTDLLEAWTDLESDGPLGIDRPVVFNDPNPPTGSVFYRVKVVNP